MEHAQSLGNLQEIQFFFFAGLGKNSPSNNDNQLSLSTWEILENYDISGRLGDPPVGVGDEACNACATLQLRLGQIGGCGRGC